MGKKNGLRKIEDTEEGLGGIPGAKQRHLDADMVEKILYALYTMRRYYDDTQRLRDEIKKIEDTDIPKVWKDRCMEIVQRHSDEIQQVFRAIKYIQMFQQDQDYVKKSLKAYNITKSVAKFVIGATFAIAGNIANIEKLGTMVAKLGTDKAPSGAAMYGQYMKEIEKCYKTLEYGWWKMCENKRLRANRSGTSAHKDTFQSGYDMDYTTPTKILTLGICCDMTPAQAVDDAKKRFQETLLSLRSIRLSQNEWPKANEWFHRLNNLGFKGQTIAPDGIKIQEGKIAENDTWARRFVFVAYPTGTGTQHDDKEKEKIINGLKKHAPKVQFAAFRTDTKPTSICYAGTENVKEYDERNGKKPIVGVVQFKEFVKISECSFLTNAELLGSFNVYIHHYQIEGDIKDWTNHAEVCGLLSTAPKELPYPTLQQNYIEELQEQLIPENGVSFNSVPTNIYARKFLFVAYPTQTNGVCTKTVTRLRLNPTKLQAVYADLVHTLSPSIDDRVDFHQKAVHISYDADKGIIFGMVELVPGKVKSLQGHNISKFIKQFTNNAKHELSGKLFRVDPSFKIIPENYGKIRDLAMDQPLSRIVTRLNNAEQAGAEQVATHAQQTGHHRFYGLADENGNTSLFTVNLSQDRYLKAVAAQTGLRFTSQTPLNPIEFIKPGTTINMLKVMNDLKERMTDVENGNVKVTTGTHNGL